MITVTQTINDFFGSGVIVDGTGIIMNDEMDDFVSGNPEHNNAPAPGKRPLSSITPVIVLKDASRKVPSTTMAARPARNAA